LDDFFSLPAATQMVEVFALLVVLRMIVSLIEEFPGDEALDMLLKTRNIEKQPL